MNKRANFPIGSCIQQQVLECDFCRDPARLILAQQFGFFSSGEMQNVKPSLIFFGKREGKLRGGKGCLIVLNLRVNCRIGDACKLFASLSNSCLIFSMNRNEAIAISKNPL